MKVTWLLGKLTQLRMCGIAFSAADPLATLNPTALTLPLTDAPYAVHRIQVIVIIVIQGMYLSEAKDTSNTAPTVQLAWAV